MQQNWVLMQVGDLSKQIIDHPIVATLGGLFMYVFGVLYGSSEVAAIGISLFALLIGLDWLVGTSAAKKDGIDTSSYGIDGFKRTIFLLALPIFAHAGDVYMGTGVIIMGGVLAGLARSVVRSILANSKRAGWGKWFPESWLQWIADELEHKEARAKRRFDEIKKDRDGA